MNTASRWMMILGLAAVVAGVTLSAPRVEAQDVEITGPLAGAPAVRRMRIYRDGRFQMQPTFGVTLNDEFNRMFAAGLQLQYHFTDWLGVGAFFDYGVYNLPTSLTDQIGDRGLTVPNNRLSFPDASKFKDQIGQLKFVAGAQVTFIPLRGKLGLFQALFVDSDFYIFGGAAAVQVQERADLIGTEAKNCANGLSGGVPVDATQFSALCSQTASATRIAIAPTFGVGLSAYLTNYMALTLEYRAFPFRWNTSGTDEAGLAPGGKSDANGEFPDGELDADDRLFHFNQMFKLGLAFYLPFQGEITK
jgi:outer membrane beta-barrel protein